MRFSFSHLVSLSAGIALAAAHTLPLSSRAPVAGKEGVFLMNRIAPSGSQLYISDLDGSNTRLLLGNNSAYDYHASFSANGKWISFTSERNGDGQSDIYRVHPDGTGLELLVASSAYEGASALSPDGSKLAYVSSANGYVANVWVLDIATGESKNLTNTAGITGVSWSPDGYFRPSWSPDGEWIAFSSDRNTAWTGHNNGTGWEHTQELSVYIIRPDGTGFRQVATKPGYSLGSPKWSPDGSRIVFYELTLQGTWDARQSFSVATAEGSLVSVDVKTGLNRTVHAKGPGVKLFPQYLSNSEIGYLAKGSDLQGLNYTSNRTSVFGNFHSPAWSPDGKFVVYEATNWTSRVQEKPLYSWQSEWDYRFTDVFPALSYQQEPVLAITDKQQGDSSIITMQPDGENWNLTFYVYASDQVSQSSVASGGAGAFQSSWSRDGEWIAFGLGYWFQARSTSPGYIYRVKADGSEWEQLTNLTVNSGFPTYSSNGETIVFRVYGTEFGLRTLNLTDGSITTLTTEPDNLPMFSPDGEKIVFTRRMNYTNFDVCTIRPDGTDLQVLTSSGANDAHAVWSRDGRILYNSGMYGFREEAAIYDDAFQPYGQIIIMNADGSNKTMLTDSMWEDAMPLYIPNEDLE